MKEKKKGFTLIELLAVIVILAVIALIATPIVLNLINTARKGAFTRSAEGVLKSAKLYYSSSLLQPNGPEDIIFTCLNNECISDKVDENNNLIKLDVDGNMGRGNITIKSDGNILFTLTNDKYCAVKYENNPRVQLVDGNCSNVDLTNDTTQPEIYSVTTVVTTNSIRVSVGAKDNESGIYGYEYSIDGGENYTDIIRNNTYIFENLKNDKEYNVKVRVYNGIYGKDTYSDEKGRNEKEFENNPISLNTIEAPEIKVEPADWATEKEVTIIYPSVTIKEYSTDGGNTFKEYISSFKVEDNINIIAKASDGINKVRKSETISKIDRELPTVEVSDINTSYETKDEITLTLNDNLSGVTHYCVTSENISDNCNWISGNGIVKYTINTNGTYYAYSKDLVGNISDAKEFVIDKIDTEEPTALLELESKTTNSITVKTTCTDNVGITKYEYSKDNGVSYEIGENETYTFSNLTTGTYNMKVRCSDEAGNSAVGNVTINTEDLGVPSISVSNSGVWSTSKTVTIDYNDTININEYRIESGSATKEDGTALTVGTWYQTSNKEEKVIFTSNGNISVRKSDGTNTLTPVSQNVSMIDTTVPTVSYSVAGGIYSSKQTIRVTASDDNFDTLAVHVWVGEVEDYEFFSATQSTNGVTEPYFDVTLEDGTWTIYSLVTDKAGNNQTQLPQSQYKWYYQTYTIDTTAPNLTLGAASATKDSITVPYTVSDSESEIDTTTCEYGTSTSYGSTGTISESNCVMSGLNSNTTYYYKVTTTDKAGNSTSQTGSSTTNTADDCETIIDSCINSCYSGCVSGTEAYQKLYDSCVTSNSSNIDACTTSTGNRSSCEKSIASACASSNCTSCRGVCVSGVSGGKCSY